MGMRRFDINMLPWHEHRQQRWQRQKGWLYGSVVMLVGWCGCGHLWHSGWRNHLAERQRIYMQHVDAQRAPERRRQESQWAAEQWRLDAMTHQQRRLEDQQALVSLWQALTMAGLPVQSVDWQPEQIQMKVINPSHRPLDEHVYSVAPQLTCQALSETFLRCTRLDDQSREGRHD